MGFVFASVVCFLVLAFKVLFSLEIEWLFLRTEPAFHIYYANVLGLKSELLRLSLRTKSPTSIMETLEAYVELRSSEYVCPEDWSVRDDYSYILVQQLR